MTAADPRIHAALFVGAFGLYALTATPGAFWLDSSELAAAGITLGVPHAPGHPLYVILAYAASLVPLGPVGFRIALLSAAFGALSVALLYQITHELIRLWDKAAKAQWYAWLPALTFALCDALWFQSVRAEVYTLHLALTLGLFVLALRWRHQASRSLAPLITGAFVLGLGAGNHHLLLLAACPALAIFLIGERAQRPRVWAALPTLFGFLFVGLLIYLLLPLRALHDPMVNYGHPNTLPRFLNVVAATVFTSSVTGVETPWAENFQGALEMFLASLGPLWLLLGPVGLWALWRRQAQLATALAVAIGGNLATKLLMVLDPTNPDAAGYFQLSIALTLSLGGVALAMLSTSSRAGRITALSAALGACMITLALLPLERVDLSDLKGPEVVDTSMHLHSPPEALIMTSFFGHHFNGLYQRAVAGYRPDLEVLHQGFEDHIEGGRPFMESATRRIPALTPALEAKQRGGTFPTEQLQALALKRPVLLEPTFGLPAPPEALHYRSGLYALSPAPAAEELARQRETQNSLLTALGAEAREQRETLTTIAMLWLTTAATRLRQGSAQGALAALESTDALSPGSRWVKALRQPTRALIEAEQSGDPRRLAHLKAALRDRDFGDVLGGP